MLVTSRISSNQAREWLATDRATINLDSEDFGATEVILGRYANESYDGFDCRRTTVLQESVPNYRTSLMYCSQCGAQFASQAKFCSHCGAAVTVPGATTMPSATHELQPSIDEPIVASVVTVSPNSPPSDSVSDVIVPPMIQDQHPGPLIVPKPAPASHVVAPSKMVSPPPVGIPKPDANSEKSARTNWFASFDSALGKHPTADATVCCVVVGIGTLIIVPTPIAARLISVAIYLAVAFGIWKMSRIAAIIGMLLAISNVVVALLVIFADPSQLDPKYAFAAVLFVGFWIKSLFSAIQVTFAYHRDQYRLAK